MSDSSRLRLAASALLVLVFGSGVVVGLALDRAVTPASGAPSEGVVATGPSSDDEAEEDDQPRYVIDEVEMSAGQRAQVDSILEFYRAEVARAAEEHREQYSRQVSATREAIRALLTDEQRARYDSLRAVRRAERDAEEAPSSGGG